MHSQAFVFSPGQRVVWVAAVTVGWCSGGLVRYSFTYHQGPITSRSETLDLHGMVRGTFNFLDSTGSIKTRHYDYRAEIGRPWVNVSPSKDEFSPQKTEFSFADIKLDPMFQHHDDSEDRVKESDVVTEEPESVQHVTTILPPEPEPEPEQRKAKEADTPESIPASAPTTPASIAANESV